MDARCNVLVGQDLVLRLIRSAGGDDVGAENRLVDALADDDVEAERLEVAAELFHCLIIDVVDGDVLDAQHATEPERLELGLGASTDHRHGLGILARQVLRHHRGRRSGAERGKQGHFGLEGRVAVVDIGKHAEGRHGLEAAGRVGRVTVDVLEGVLFAIGRRHELDDAERGVGRDARDLVEQLPALVVALEVADHAGDDVFHTIALDPAGHVVDIDKLNHEEFLS